MPAVPVPRVPVLAAVLAVVLLLAGCGGAAAPPATGESATGEFPRTITHAYGTTTIPAKPQRVVALGVNDLAVAQTIGAPVVGATQNVSGTSPALPYLSPLPPDVLALDPSAPFSPERIAAFRPDLILAVSAYQLADRASYDRLSAIAPTVTFRTSLYGDSMQDDARQIGRALGEEPQVEQLIAAADKRVADVRAELPGLAGKTYLFGQARGEILPMVVGEKNQSTVFMRSLGLVVPQSFASQEASNNLAPGTVGVSYEEAGRLAEANLLLMTFAGTNDRGTFEANELVLRAMRSTTYMPLTLDQAVALQAPNVVSTGWLLDQLHPALQKVADRR